MATVQIVAQRRAVALQRLADSQKSISGRIGVESEQQPLTNRDSEIAGIQQLENLANFLEAVDEKLAAPKPTKPAK